MAEILDYTDASARESYEIEFTSEDLAQLRRGEKLVVESVTIDPAQLDIRELDLIEDGYPVQLNLVGFDVEASFSS